MSAQHQPPPKAVANLPVFATLIEALVITFSQPLLLFRAAAGGLLLLAATTAVALMLEASSFSLLLLVVGPLAAYSHLGVNWYRVVLLGPAGLVRPTLQWDRRHWRFLSYGLFLTAALLSLGLALTAMLPISAALVLVVLVYIAARCSFLFAAVAVEEPYTLAFSWRHTKGQGLRLTAALLLAALPLTLVVAMITAWLFFAALGISLFDLAALQASGQPLDEATLGQLAEDGRAIEVSPLISLSLKMVSEALSMIVLAVLFAIVALAFRTCTGWVPAQPGNLPAAPDQGQDNSPDDPANSA